MARTKDPGKRDRGTFARFRTQSDELLVANAIIARLLGDGHTVSERERPQASAGRSPDFVITLDGQRVALEVVRLLPPPEVGRAENRIREVEWALKSELHPDAVGLGGWLVANVMYVLDPLRKHGRPELQRDVTQLASDIRCAIAETDDRPFEFVEMPSAVPWLLRCDLSLLDGLEPGFSFTVARDPAIPVADMDGFVARTIASKRDQHIGHADRAILGVRAMFDDSQELRDAFSSSPDPVPWWRVYLVQTGGDSYLVHDADAPPPVVAPPGFSAVD